MLGRPFQIALRACILNEYLGIPVSRILNLAGDAVENVIPVSACNQIIAGNDAANRGIGNGGPPPLAVLLLDPLSFGGSDSPAGAQALLNEYGIAHNVIQSDLLNRPEARPGTQGQWEWRIVGMGKAVPVRRPKDISWRQLG